MIREYRDAVGQLQRTAYRNLRTTIAMGCALIGFFAAVLLTQGDDRMLPLVVSIVGGVLGVACLFVRSWILLGVAAVVAVAGIVLAAAA